MVALPARAQGPNIVTNPGFETGDFTGWTTTAAASGSDLGVSGFSHSGNYAAYLGATQGLDDSISQTLPTIAGDSYSISFWLINAGGEGNEFHASFGGDTLLELQEAPTFGYQQYTFTDTAIGTATPLTFAGRTPPGFFHLDDISVNDLGSAPVPEASTTVSLGLLLALGLGGVMVAAAQSLTYPCRVAACRALLKSGAASGDPTFFLSLPRPSRE